VAATFSQEIDVMNDGGFESGEIVAPVPGQPVSGVWTADAFPAGDPSRVEAVNDPVLTGGFAAQIDTLAAQSGRFIYQDFEGGTGCFTWTFNVYPEGGVSTAELLQDWDRGAGAAQFVSRVNFNADGTAFSGWNAASRTLSLVLTPGEWHEVVVEADADTLTQTLTIDDERLAQFQARVADTVAETIILGDVAGRAGKGLYTYDDVSLTVRECAGVAPGTDGVSTGVASQPTDAPETASEEPDDGDDGGSPWWILLLAIIALLIILLLLFLWRRRRKGAQSDESA
jgi:hypothetical protein